MGKSRHMKEIANHLPSVYICLRTEVRGYGYPLPSPSIVEWSSKGATTLVGKEVKEEHFHFSTFRWSAFIISTISILAKWINDGRFFKSLAINDRNIKRFEFALLWKFFAEPPNDRELKEFWIEVQGMTSSQLKKHQSGSSAHTYFQTKQKKDLANAENALAQCFRKHQINDLPPLIFIFDEARTLCQHEAYDGTRLYEEHALTFHQRKEAPLEPVRPMPFLSFSNFRALRRALRYLSIGYTGVPQIFAVFTDTTSRITNFQPTSWNDPSLRIQGLPAAGPRQFPPIFVFSSIDVYSRVLNQPMCISSSEDVADPDRLLKFGRAGWYATYFHANGLHNTDVVDTDTILRTAKSKLLAISDPAVNHVFEGPPAVNLIKLLAVLAPRLALTIGPYTLEASELIASHLAVLTRTDDERHFLRTVYPSEPILAEVSAGLTHEHGWASPLSALVHYVKGGIVDAGFRGELITKIVCLMAMDRALSQIPLPPNRWLFSRPIPVSDFLDHLIVPLQGYLTFSEGLKGVQDRDNIPPGTLNIDDEKLQRFLRGRVFFNHFIRVEVKLSYSMLVHAWNRGAAIMCKTNTKGIDHVIPVMLDTNGDAMFGPLHGPWRTEHIEQARQHLSYILINSRNYASGKDQIGAAWAAKFSQTNLREYGQSSHAMEPDLSHDTESQCEVTFEEDLVPDSQYVFQDEDDGAVGTDEETKDVEMDELEMDNVFLSMVQDFGNKRRNEPWVAVGSVLRVYARPRRAQPALDHPPLENQFIVVLKGVGANTYKCLKEPSDSPPNRLQNTTRYLEELRSGKVDYVDKNGKWKRIAAMQNIPLVYGETMLGSANWDTNRPALQARWQAEQQPPTDVADDMSIDGSESSHYSY